MLKIRWTDPHSDQPISDHETASATDAAMDETTRRQTGERAIGSTGDGMRALRRGIAALALGAAGTIGASAQQAPPADAVGVAAPATVARPVPRPFVRRRPRTDGQGFAGATSAAGAADTLGQTATPPTLPPGTLGLGNGLSLLANYTGQGAINPIGGIRQGSAWAGQLVFGIDGDLQRLAGIEGGSFHVALTNRHGRSLAQDDIGNNTSVQEIYGGGQTTRLTLLSYQQTLFDNRLDIEVGRLVANISFLNSPLYCNFQTNSACGNPTFVFKTSNFTFWPVASWGGHAKAWLTDRVFVHVGAYEVNPRHQQPGDNGLDLSTRGATGAIVPFELGYATTFANDPLPRNYGIGGWYDASDYADPVRDVTGRPAVLTGLAPLTRFGRSGVYARFDQMVWRPDPTAIQGLTMFGVAMAGTSGRLVEDYFLEIGALQTGTVAGRPYDTLGFVINTQKFSPLARQHRAGAGRDRPEPPDPDGAGDDGAQLRHPGHARDPADAEPAVHRQPGPDPLPVPPQEHPRRFRGRRQALGGPVHAGRAGAGARELVRAREPSPLCGEGRHASRPTDPTPRCGPAKPGAIARTLPERARPAGRMNGAACRSTHRQSGASRIWRASRSPRMTWRRSRASSTPSWPSSSSSARWTSRASSR